MTLREELNGYLKPKKDFFGIPEPESGLPTVGVLGVPYDMTSSYLPGCRFGPDAIRAATDSERSHSFPLSIGHPKFPDEKALSKRMTLEDIGDLEVGIQLPESAMYHISEAASKLVKHESYLLFLGGDHYITYPLLNGIKKGKKGNIGLVYLDAHADMYQDMGGSTLSHATTLKRIISEEIVQKEDVVAHDLRSALPNQRNELATENPLQRHNLKSFTDSITDIANRVDSLYISIDLDVLRPEIAPGVSHPESGGIDMVELVKLLRACFDTMKVVYVDIVELNPLLDKSGLTTAAARDAVKEILTGFTIQKEYK
ncbi:MAG: arginase family protein [Candidatus Thorarchaeota archaeon]|jgi:agmatinase